MNVFNKYLAKISPFAFIVATFLYSFFRTPCFDESFAYIISRMNFYEIFTITRFEGHNLIWYLILKLFSHNINFYPYSMLFVNWIIASVLIVFFWKKAPFNNIIKFLITFSYPFLNYFGVVSRPYTLGVLILFLICFLYKNQLKRPVLYSFLVSLFGNISIINLFGAFAFFILFLINCFKYRLSKKNIVICGLVFIFSFVFLLSQFIGAQIPERQASLVNEIVNFKLDALSFLGLFFLNIEDKTFLRILFFIVSSGVFWVYSAVFLKKARQSFLFLFIIYILMSTFFIKVYLGNVWHYYFYFVYFIAALWISWDKIKNVKYINIILYCFLFLSLFQTCFINKKLPETLDTRTYKTMIDVIFDNQEFKNSKLFYLDWFYHFFPGVAPYLEQKNIKIYDIEGKDRTTFQSAKNIDKFRTTPFYGGEFIKHLDKTKNNYLITQNYIFYQGFRAKELYFTKNGFIYTDDKCKIFFEIVKFMPNIPFSIYKINVVDVYEK